MAFSILVHLDTESVRADLALFKEFNKLGYPVSRSLIKQWLKEPGFTLKTHRLEPSFILPPGTHEVILLDSSVLEELLIGPLPSTHPDLLPVIYEDEDLLILDKKSGIPSVPLRAPETETAVGVALARVPSLSGIGRKKLEPGLIHRLDTGTSGLLVFAKTQVEFERLSLAWKKREVKKIYRALAQSPSRPLPRLPLQIDFPLAHDSHSSKRMIVLHPDRKRKSRGRPLPAMTRILSVKNFKKIQFTGEADSSRAEILADFEIEIITGVMHQIRCHLADLGWPILGDGIYRGAPAERLWLHAWRLEIPLKNKKLLNVEAQLPEGWKF